MQIGHLKRSGSGPITSATTCRDVVALVLLDEEASALRRLLGPGSGNDILAIITNKNTVIKLVLISCLRENKSALEQLN